MRRSSDLATSSEPGQVAPSQFQDTLQQLLAEAETAPQEDGPGLALRMIALGSEALGAIVDLEHAERCLEEAIGVDPDCEEALGLAQAIDSLRNGWKEEARRLAGQAGEERDRKVASGHCLRAASLLDVFDSSKEGDERFSDLLERSVLYWSSNPALLPLLRRRHDRKDDTAGFQKAVESLLSKVTEEAGRAELQSALAQAKEDIEEIQPANTLQAFGDLSRRFQEDPLDRALRARLLDLARRSELLEELEERWSEILPTVQEGEGRLSFEDDLSLLLEQCRNLARREGRGEGEREYALRLANLLGKTEPKRALSLYSDVLESDPHNGAASEGLVALWQGGGEVASAAWESLDRSLDLSNQQQRRIELREARLEEEIEASRRFVLLGEIRSIAAQAQLPRLAFDAAARAFREGSRGEEAQLEKLARRADALAELADLYEVEASKLEAEEARPFLVLAARIHQDELGDPRGAAERWAAIASSYPEDLGALQNLEALHRQAGMQGELAAVLLQRSALEKAPHRRRALLLEIAKIREVELSDEDGAIAALGKILEENAADREALSATSRILSSARRWGELAALYEDQIDLASGKGAAQEVRDLRVELAKVLLRRQGDPVEAMEHFREVLLEQPRHPGTLAALKELVEEGDEKRKVAAAEVLAPIFLEERDFSRHLQMLEILASVEADPKEKSRLFLRIAEIHSGPLPMPALAFVGAGRALRADPDDPAALSAVLSHGKKAGMEEELIALLEEVAPHGSTADSRLRLHLALARRCEEAGEDESALRAWLVAKSVEPGEKEILEAIVRLRSKGTDGPAYVDALRNLVANLEADEEKLPRLLEIAKVQQEWNGDLSAAWATLRGAHDLAREDSSILEKMEEISSRLERWGDLAHILEKRIEITKGGRDSIAPLLRLASLKESRLLDREGALDLFERVLEKNPAEPEAVRRLEGMLEADPSSQDTARILEKAYRGASNWAELAQVLDHRVAFAKDPEGRKALLLELSDLQKGRLGREDLAFLSLARAFREDPKDRELWKKLTAVATSADVLDEWLGLAEEELDRFSDPEEAAALATHLARMLESEGDHGAAASFWERTLSLDASSAAALLALDASYLRTERWGELAGIVERMVELTEEPRERAVLLSRLALLYEQRLSDPAKATRAWEAILEDDPAHLPALRALETLFEADGRVEALYENLLAQRAAAEGAAEERLTLRLAEVAQERLLDPDRAIAHYREALGKSPKNTRLQERLADLYEVQERWSDQAALLRAWIDGTTDPREAIRLQLRLGASLQAHGGDPQDVIRCYRAVLEKDPRNLEALGALRSILGASQDDEALVDILRRMIPLQDDSLRIKAIRLELVEALVRQDKKPEAVDAIRRVLDLEPHGREDLVRIEGLLLGLGAHRELIRTLEALAEGEEDPPRKVERLREIARLWSEEVGRPEMAAQALERILELQPLDVDAFQSLRGFYREGADWRRYAVATEAYASLVEGPEEKVGLLRDLARVQEERLGQKELAFGKLASALGLAPSDQELLDDLAGLADRGSMHDELAMVLENVAEEAGQASQGLWLLRGELLDLHLDEADEAEASFEKVLAQDPYHQKALSSLERLFERRSQGAKLVGVLEKQVEIASSQEERRALLVRIGGLQGETLRDVEAAIYSLRRAFDLDPKQQDAFLSLASLFRREQRFLDLVALLSRVRDLSEGQEEKIAKERELAEIHELHLDDDEEAIAAFSRILEIDPDHLPALDALERLYTSTDRATDLLRVYDRKLHLTEEQPKERARIFLKAASIWEEKLGNIPNAIACLDGALTLEPENLSALRDLERLLRAEAQWQRLVEIYRHHESILHRDPSRGEERVEIWTRLGEVYLEELHQVDKAEQAYRAAFELDPRARQALAGLGAIYERSGNWPDALALLEQQVASVGPGPEAVELFHRIGRIQGEMLQDLASAQVAFENARALDAGHLPSIRALKEIVRDRGEQDAFLDLLLQEAAFTKEATEKAALFYEAGTFQLERGDRSAAIRLFEEALRCFAGHLGAARTLADLQVQAEDWDGAERALDGLCALLSPRANGAELVQRLYRLAFVCEKIENGPKALETYAKSYELDTTYLPAAEGLARLRLWTGDWVQALKIYQSILIHHREELSEPEVVEIHFTIGDLRGKLGDRSAALKSLRNALELDPWHLPSLRASIDFSEDEGDHATALVHRRKLLEVVKGDDALALLRSTAKLAKDKLHDPHVAIDCLTSLLRLAPTDLEAMEELLYLFRETRQGPKAIALLERMLTTPAAKEDPRRASAFHRLLGEIHRDEGRSAADWLEHAARHFESALNLDWKQIEAFSSLEKMLVGARQWALLEESYLRMIERLSGKLGFETARTSLFRNLADLYFEVLSKQEEAVQAYKAVVALDPNDTVARERYAELVAKEAGSEEEAIGAYRRLLATPESRVAASKALVKLHAKRKALDDAFVSAQVVSHLMGEGGRDEEGILARLRPFVRDSAEGALVEEDWTELLSHPDAKGPVATIFSLILQEAGHAFAGNPSSLEVQGKTLQINSDQDRIDLDGSMLFFANAYRYVSSAMGMEPASLFQAQGITGLCLGDTSPVSLLAGPDMLSDRRSKKELYFLIGRNLAFTRPELSLAALRRRDELQLLLEAALSLGEPRFQPTSDPRQVEGIRTRLAQSLSQEATERLSVLARESVGKRLSLRRYVEGAEHTATRVGALLCGDLQIVSRCLASDGGAGGRLELSLLLEGLAEFCLSEPYGELRKRIGLAVVLPA